jgi:hypothetical protein
MAVGAAVGVGKFAQGGAPGPRWGDGRLPLGRGVKSHQMFAERWNGHAWSVTPMPKPPGSQGENAVGVSCTSRTFCMAVGDYESRHAGLLPFGEVWDGSSWRFVEPSPSGSSSAFTAVACISPSSCVAVGSTGSRPLAERWDGGSWTRVHIPTPDRNGFTALVGVSCAAENTCTAVGSFEPPTAGPVTLAEAWDGVRWSIVPTPNPAGSEASALSGVSCLSAAFCMAAGAYQQPAGPSRTLAETWDGSAWSIVPTADLPIHSDWLTDVACTAASACVAVGRSTSRVSSSTLAETWDGSAWSIERTPDATKLDGLYGVACTAPETCISVGDAITGWVDTALSERYSA